MCAAVEQNPKQEGCVIDAKPEFEVREFCLRILKEVSDEIGEYMANVAET